MKYFLFITLLLASCNINMAYEKQIAKRYYLIATDAMDQLDISRALEKMAATLDVFLKECRVML